VPVLIPVMRVPDGTERVISTPGRMFGPAGGMGRAASERGPPPAAAGLADGRSPLLPE